MMRDEEAGDFECFAEIGRAICSVSSSSSSSSIWRQISAHPLDTDLRAASIGSICARPELPVGGEVYWVCEISVSFTCRQRKLDLLQWYFIIPRGSHTDAFNFVKTPLYPEYLIARDSWVGYLFVKRRLHSLRSWDSSSIKLVIANKLWRVFSQFYCSVVKIRLLLSSMQSDWVLMWVHPRQIYLNKTSCMFAGFSDQIVLPAVTSPFSW